MTVSSGESGERSLRISFHGRIIDHLGIQMYQSPVAAIAEMVSNAWDADAEHVNILLPASLEESAVISVQDDGVGMTFEECESCYLAVGNCRRDDSEFSASKNRRVLGRKGIGKFAGFGIAECIVVDTVSAITGEHTKFALDIDELRQGGYVEADGRKVVVLEYDPPDAARLSEHGTRITLERLTISRRPSANSFARSMASRFLLAQRADIFKVCVDGVPIPDSIDRDKLEYCFPADYKDEERPPGMQVDQGWGIETLSNGQQIRWRVFFYEDPVGEEDFRGVAIFAHGKLAQRPFFFNLSGGLGGQHGQQYMTGQVEADFVDELPKDLIATERQRINWEDPETQPLETWGQDRVRSLLRLWKERRGERRQKQIEERLFAFAVRLGKLPNHERKTVKQALQKLGSIESLSDGQFEDTGQALLLAWEQGRLRNLIDELASAEDLSEQELLSILIEAQVLTALNAAEAVKTKIETVRGLKDRIERKELETAVRDYIADNPWLVSPQWETFQVERGVAGLLADAAKGADLVGPDWGGRVDLALSSGDQLLILEFMRPGLKVDWDHVQRFERYVRTVRTRVGSLTGQSLRRVSGYIVADELSKSPEMNEKFAALSSEQMYALDWRTLFEEAIRTWRDFLDILVRRAPEDERLQALVDETDTLSSPLAETP